MRCPKCQGCQIMSEERVDTLMLRQWRCLNCGRRSELGYVAVPLTVNPRRQWESELCPRCMTWAAVRKHHLCRSCQGQAIAVGLEKARRVG